jgi:ferric-dicitrate binding protein FerR (iron transport regulator)
MRRKKLESVGLEPPAWVNDAGYRYRSRRAFDAAQAQIHAERRALQLVRAGERLASEAREERAAASPKFPRPPYAPPERGGQGSAVAVVVIAAALALATLMALLVYLLVSLG